MDLMEAAKYAVNRAIGLGASQADSYVFKREAVILRVIDGRRGERKRVAERKTVSGVNLRVTLNKSVGYSYATELVRERVDEAVKRALKVAKVIGEDRRFKSLPEPSEPSRVSGIYDKSFEMVDFEEYISILRAFNDGILVRNRYIKTVDTGFTFEVEDKAIYNSLGVDVEFKRSAGECYLMLNALKDGISASASDYIQSTRIEELKPENLEVEVLEYLNLGLKPIKVQSGVKNLIFHPKALSALMRYAFVAAIDGYNVLEGKSYLSGRIGDQVASDGLTIIDDGTMKNGLFSEPADAEGVPTKRTYVIEKGILKSYLHDSYTANVNGLESTGNAFRDLRGRVTVGPRNEVIVGETVEFEEMTMEVGEGLLIRDLMGAHSANIGSGAFSVVSPIAYVVEEGELRGSVKNAVVSGMFGKLLRNYWMQGGAVRGAGFLVAPMVTFKNVDVVIP